MSRRIKSVSADPKTYTLRLEWRHGAVTTKAMLPLIRRKPAFAILEDPKLFAKVRAMHAGNAVAWPGTEADIAADKLWYDAHPEDNPYVDVVMTAAEFQRWVADNGYSLDAAAAALGVSRRQIAYYSSGGKPVPKLVFLACMALNELRRRRSKRLTKAA